MYKNGYSRGLFYNKKQKKSKFSFLSFLIIAPLSLICIVVIAEFVARFYFNVTGKTEELNLAPEESIELAKYRLQFLDNNGQPLDLISEQGNLKVTRKLASGYQLIPGQKSEFWQINEQGFRYHESLSINKPQNEIRIFILGGSTAFGYLNANNESTIAHQLEQRLEQRVQQQQTQPETYRPDVFPFFQPLREEAMAKPPKIRQGKYRVINAAIPGYTSGNQLGKLALEILPYQPDLIIVLDGYGDLMLSSNYEAMEIPKIEKYLANAPAHFEAYLEQYLQQKFENIYLIKLAQKWFNSSDFSQVNQSLVIKEEAHKPLVNYLSQDEGELKRRVQRYQENQRKLVNLSNKIGIPVILALQPEITGRNPDKLSDSERVIVQELGESYQNRLPNQYPHLAQSLKELAKINPKNIRILDLYKLNDNYPSPSFVDAVHLTEAANKIIADQLYYTITSLEKMQIIPQFFYLDLKREPPLKGKSE
jgi:lysophospholipase L1-like esterase